MKVLMSKGSILLLCFVYNMCFANTQINNNKEMIFVSAKIYDVTSTTTAKDIENQLSNAKLISSPELLVEVGKDAMFELNDTSNIAQEKDVIQLYIQFNQSNERFDLDFRLRSEDKQSISRLENNPLNSSLAISANINGTTKIVKISTERLGGDFISTQLNSTDKVSFQHISIEQKTNLATEVATCYAAHKKVVTNMYRSGEAEKYKALIGDLIGKSNINHEVNLAVRKISTSSRGIAHIIGKRHCKSIDEKLLQLIKTN